MTGTQWLGAVILTGLALGLFALLVKWSSFKEVSQAVIFVALVYGLLSLGLWLVEGGGHV